MSAESRFVAIEPRPYGPDATEAEKAAIRGRVTMCEGSIVELVELPVLTRFTLELMLAEVDRLTAHLPTYKVLVDLRQSARPTAEQREALRAGLRSRDARLRHVALFTNGFLVSVAARFVFGHFGMARVTTHTSRASALEALRGSG